MEIREMTIGQKTKLAKDIMDVGDHVTFSSRRPTRITRILELHRNILFGILNIQDLNTPKQDRQLRRLLNYNKI